MGDDGDKIGWMYEGTKAIVNREDYLLGKKIDKNFELYSDVFEKDKDEDRLKHLEQSSVDACKGEAGTSKVSSLQIDVVRTEDPLVALKEQRRREFIENPLNKLKYEKMMRKAFEEMKKAAAEAGDEKKKKSRKDKKKKKKRRDSTSSDEEPEAESKLKGWDSEESSPESHRHGRADSKSLRKEEQKRPARRSPSESKQKRRYSESSSSSPQRRRRHSPAESKRRGSSPAERRDSPARRWRRRVSSSPESHHRKHSDSKRSVHSRDHDRKSRRERRRSRSASPKRQHRPSDRRRRSRSGSPEFRSRDEKKVEKKKPRLTDAEREAKRLEMMSNAKWRDDLRTKNVTMAATDDQKELDNENGKVANFIKPLVHSVTDNMTVEDKLRVKRKQLQSSHGYMDKL